MKKIWNIILLTLLMNSSYGQINLVPNPSFEDTVSCATSAGQINKAESWVSFGNSPDYFNACSNEYYSSVPINAFGYQNAYSGVAYAGFYTYYFGNYREYLGAELIQHLVTGTQYYISFRIVCADNDSFLCKNFTNNMGVLFSNTLYSEINPIQTGNYSHLHSTNVITDSTNWISINGIFVADSDYQYIVLGNFYNNINTDTIHFNIPGPWQFSYYFIDNICVSDDSSRCYGGVNGIHELIYEDILIETLDKGGLFLVKNLQNRFDKIELFSSTGQKLLLNSDGNFGYSMSIDIRDYSPGVYILVFQGKRLSEHLIKKIIKL